MTVRWGTPRPDRRPPATEHAVAIGLLIAAVLALLIFTGSLP